MVKLQNIAPHPLRINLSGKYTVVEPKGFVEIQDSQYALTMQHFPHQLRTVVAEVKKEEKLKAKQEAKLEKAEVKPEVK